METCPKNGVGNTRIFPSDVHIERGILRSEDVQMVCSPVQESRCAWGINKIDHKRRGKGPTPLEYEYVFAEGRPCFQRCPTSA